ncbi:MAG: DUF1479 family protein [Alphaproteobacteria bacterium]|nr:DUF1479 family protein [Alphaproteobacteria bacterium]
MADIATFKRQVALDLRAAEAVRRAVAVLAARAADGEVLVPQIAGDAIVAGEVDARDVRERGCVVVRGLFARAQAAAWDRELAAYLHANDADARTHAKRPGRWPGAPQIYSVYWSVPQIAARQHPRFAAVAAWLNGLWHGTEHFDPGANCTYADRIRRRTPGDATLALGPHIDGGTAGRWLDPALRAPYRAVFESDPAAFDPFDATDRVTAPATDDANACSAFRTWQGWTALTAQGPGDGTLQVVPLTRAIVWVLLRPFARDVPEASLCGAESARALWITEDWHAPLLRALVPIPHVEPGDAVFWHPDLIHAVEPVHAGRTPSNVMYIPAVPDCPRNRAMQARQLPAFLEGRSPPDFPPDDLEVDFAGRATSASLSPEGRRQMGVDERGRRNPGRD